MLNILSVKRLSDPDERITFISKTTTFYFKNIEFPGGTSLADPAADLRFFYAQNANFSQFFLRLLRSRLILSIILIEIWPKHAKI